MGEGELGAALCGNVLTSWQIRLRKVLLAVVAGVLVTLHTVSLGFVAVKRESTTAVASNILQIAYTLYNLVLAVVAIGHSEVLAHGRFVVHLAALSTLGFVLNLIASITPSGSTFQSAPEEALWYASLAFWFISFWLSARMKRGPPLQFPSERIYTEKTLSGVTTKVEDNVCGIVGGSPWDIILFTYTTKVVMLGYTSESLEIGDLPILPGNRRATYIFSKMKEATKKYKIKSARPGSGLQLAWQVFRANFKMFGVIAVLVSISALLYYVPALFLKLFVSYLEMDPDRSNPAWGWVYCAGLFGFNAMAFLVTDQMWSLSTTSLQVAIRIQLNSILFSKTLVRKDVASSTPSKSEEDKDDIGKTKADDEEDGEEDFSSKAQIMTLMTTDVDRVSQFANHFFTLIGMSLSVLSLRLLYSHVFPDAPIEIIIGIVFLYDLLGVSCFVGLAVACIFIPLNHFASKVVVFAQNNLMEARDQRVALMNEVLGSIRMLKLMAWERPFEARILKVRERDLKYQRLT